MEANIDRVVHGGIQKLYFFENGYGASVVSHRYSYGFHSNKWELAVLKYDGEGPRGEYDSWALTYDTPVTSDVIGYLDAEEIPPLLEQIKGLPCSD